MPDDPGLAAFASSLEGVLGTEDLEAKTPPDQPRPRPKETAASRLARRRDQHAVRAADRKTRGQCPRCSSQVAEGRSTCQACYERHRAYRRAYVLSPEQRKRRAAAYKAWRERVCAQGICDNCGKAPAGGGQRKCHECRIAHNARRREYYRRAKAA